MPKKRKAATRMTVMTRRVGSITIGENALLSFRRSGNKTKRVVEFHHTIHNIIWKLI